MLDGEFPLYKDLTIIWDLICFLWPWKHYGQNHDRPKPVGWRTHVNTNVCVGYTAKKCRLGSRDFHLVTQNLPAIVLGSHTYELINCSFSTESEIIDCVP